jgi:8-amino-7-oxononanoate synthase
MYIMESAPNAETVINGKKVDYFCGCGYFCLQGHPEMIKAASQAAQKYGIGSATSRSGYGNNPILLDVEKKAADFFRAETVLYYVSGYMGGTILLQGLSERYDIIFADKESHYSVKDGISIVNKPLILFEHLDPEDLRKKLKQNLKPRQIPLLVCDGVFPMTGALSPTPEYYEILKGYEKFLLCVDDAHAVGVLGEKGMGTFEYFGLQADELYLCGTLSKAFGGHGGVIPGKTEFIETLKKNSNIFYASSAPPTPAAAATAKALEIVSRNPSLKTNLHANVAYARKRFRSIGLDLGDSPVPILCLHSIDGVDLTVLQTRLWEKDIAVAYKEHRGYTSVPKGGAIRIAINTNHSKQQIDRLVGEIGALL